MLSYFKKSLLIIFLVVTALSFLSSCTVTSEKIDNADKRKSVMNSLGQLYPKESEVLTLDLKEAIRFAIENNLEYKLNKVQVALAYKQYDLAKFDLYPKIDVNAAYNHRNRDYIKNLINTPTGDSGQSLIPHTIKTGTILFNWNVLDFGLSYVRAKQASDRYLAANEERKKIAIKIISEVVKNYSLAYYAQETTKKVADLEKEIKDSIDLTDQAISQAVGEPEKLLNSKKVLLELYREMRENIVYFNQAWDKLLSLINYNSPDKLGSLQIKLLPLDPYLSKLPSIDSKLLSLDTIALYNRPELNQALYKTQEVQRQRYVSVLERLPGLGFNMGYNFDSDKYLKFQNWWSDNINVAWNLLQLAAIQPTLDTIDTQVKAQELTYLASSAVILGEIRVLLFNYKTKLLDYSLAEKQSVYNTAVYQQNLNVFSSGRGIEQDLIKDKITSINSELFKIRVFVDARSVLEDIIVSTGLYQTAGELLINDRVEHTVVEKWLANFNNNQFDNIIAAEYQNIKNV
ncbi:MAG: TolC family protein [Gammaproteobacteria bacterium]|nr:TolC family protein [Gammaproteobacteria bacterium]